MARTARRAGGGRRWAISFADVCLLLLGCVLLAQAGGGRATDAVRASLTGAPHGPAARPLAVEPDDAFEAGEAVFRRGRPALPRYGPGDRLVIESRGWDGGGGGGGGGRLDRWELAAARAAALARAAVAAGAAPDHIAIRLDDRPGPRGLTVAAR